MTFFYPKEETLKISCRYLYWKCVKKGGGSGVGVLGGRWWFLTGDMEDRVILDNMDDLGGPKRSYPEGFLSLSLFLVEIYKLVVLVKKCDMIHTDIQT